jgi:hypothetical protein
MASSAVRVPAVSPLRALAPWSVAPLAQENDAEPQHRAQRGERPVLLGVPFVAFLAEAGHAGVAADDSRRRPFDQLVDRRVRQDEQHRLETPPHAARRGPCAEHLPGSRHHQQAVAEVHQAVVEIAPRQAGFEVDGG